MIYSIDTEKINNLSTEMIIYNLFKDYPELIDWYNNYLIPLLKANNFEESIFNFRNSLFDLNINSIEWIIWQEESDLIAKSLITFYNKGKKEYETKQSLENSAKKLLSIKTKEINERNWEKENAESTINNLLF